MTKCSDLISPSRQQSRLWGTFLSELSKVVFLDQQ